MQPDFDPWVNEFDPDKAVRTHGKNPEVGSKPRGVSWVGALDMSSSLFEWTSSICRPYPDNAQDGRETPFDVDPESRRVLRGGAWYHPGTVDDITATARFKCNLPMLSGLTASVVQKISSHRY